MSYFVLSELVKKYYDPLDEMVKDLALKCVGGEEVTLTFPLGKVTIKLK